MPIKLSNIFFTLIFLICSAELFGEFTSNDTIRFIFKPLIMISIFCFYWLKSSGRVNKIRMAMGAAMLLSLGGDVSLMFVKFWEPVFILGLVLFLLAHISYIIGFLHHEKNVETLHATSLRVMFDAIPFLTFGTIFYIFLFEHLGVLKIPVLLYTIVISTMGISAAIRYRWNSKMSFAITLLGAVLFMTSDSLLAYNKFVEPFNHASFVIMLTYILAQLFIMRGMLFQLTMNNEQLK